MTIAIDLYEDSGAVLSGHGTTRIAVDNIGWKSSGLDETNSFAYYPVRRPDGVPFTYSYQKYNFFRISGTHAKATRPVIIITGADLLLADQMRLHYKLSSTYEEATGGIDGSLMYLNNTIRIYPKLSTIGPEDTGASYIQYLTSGTTYYTQYLVTQLLVESSSVYQNLPEVTVGLYLQEFENTDV